MTAHVLNFPGAVAAEFGPGALVRLNDGRDGRVDHRNFAIGEGGSAIVESYVVTLTGGRGRIEVAPRSLRCWTPLQAITSSPTGAA